MVALTKCHNCSGEDFQLFLDTKENSVIVKCAACGERLGEFKLWNFNENATNSAKGETDNSDWN